ncbi:hypothetical protein [Lapillicoccus sp.]|uniref:hypothetical protein n=1 Tax=Lapillicoccus sp. TaxID=1909287 RepID=UPI0025D0EB26|nr:hypothetical protein [Lapillicoccus sp.]
MTQRPQAPNPTRPSGRKITPGRKRGSSAADASGPVGASGPQRFRQAAPEDDRPSVLRRLLSLVALLAIVVGVPVLLLWLSGRPPIPTRLPTRDDLTQHLGVEQLLVVLVAVVWLAWLQFVVCLIVELFSAVNHHGVPRPVPFSGPSQRLARMLIGGVLLSSVVLGQVAAVTGALSDATPARPSTTISALAPGDTTSAGPVTMGPRAPDIPASTGAASAIPASTATSSSDVAGKKVYVVEPPRGHHHDSLWEIAEKHLGDGRRYKEIYALNEGRVQPGGGTLHLAKLIQPGWELVMPDDAVGVGRVPVTPPPARQAVSAPMPDLHPSTTAPTGTTGTTTPTGTTAPAVQAWAPQGSSVTGVGFLPTAPVPDNAPATAPSPDLAPPSAPGRPDQGSMSPVQPVNPLVASLATGGTFAACILLALMRQRRRNGGGSSPSALGVSAEVGLRVGADLERARWINLALRLLAARCAASLTVPPQIFAARATDDVVTLMLIQPRPAAPEPWRAEDDGATWTLRRHDLGRSSTSAGVAAYPGLVALGRDGSGADLLIDLEAAAGPIRLVGDATIAEQVAIALAIQLATQPWSDGVKVSAVGLPPEIEQLSAGVIDTTPDLAGLAERFEIRPAVAGDETLTRRLARGADGPAEYAVLAAPVAPELLARLALITSGPRRAVGLVGVGDIPDASWELVVDEAGMLTTSVLGVTLEAYRVSREALSAVAQLFGAAESVPHTPDRVGLAAVPMSPLTTDDGAFAVTEARVGFLGPITVRAPGPIDPGARPLAEEIIAYLAAHPGGVHPAVLAGAIWPRGVSQSVFTATLVRVRDWLGAGPDGLARLRVDGGGRYSLGGGVACDWHAFCTLVDRAKGTNGRIAEGENLRRALRLVRGEPFEGRADGHYSWLAGLALERSIVRSVVGVAHRLVELAREAGDAQGAAAAAGGGLRLARTSQVLWRDVLEVEQQRAGIEAVREAVDEMSRTLAAYDVPLEGETEALVTHLLGTRTPASA